MMAMDRLNEALTDFNQVIEMSPTKCGHMSDGARFI